MTDFGKLYCTCVIYLVHLSQTSVLWARKKKDTSFIFVASHTWSNTYCKIMVLRILTGRKRYRFLRIRIFSVNSAGVWYIRLTVTSLLRKGWVWVDTRARCTSSLIRMISTGMDGHWVIQIWFLFLLSWKHGRKRWCLPTSIFTGRWGSPLPRLFVCSRTGIVIRKMFGVPTRYVVSTIGMVPN